MVAGYTATLRACPSATNAEPVIEGDVAILGAYGAGELVRLNPKSPFLGSRSISLTFHENGTLKTINAEGEGKGGAIIATLIKSAAGFLTMGPLGLAAGAVGLSPQGVQGGTTPKAIACRPEVAEKVARLVEVGLLIDTLEGSIATEPQPGQAAIYERLKTEQTDLEKALTLSSSVKLRRTRRTIEPYLDAATRDYSEAHPFASIDYSDWFLSDEDHYVPVPKVGAHGYCASFSAPRSALMASRPVQTLAVRSWTQANMGSGGNLSDGKLLNRFVYLQPVPVQVEVRERKTASADCVADFANGERLGLKSVQIPQLSSYFVLPIGSGAFESRAISAEFTPEGRIVTMGTKNLGAGTGIGEALAGALAGAETMRDARTAGIQRRIDGIKAQNELDQLLEASEQSTVGEPQ